MSKTIAAAIAAALLLLTGCAQGTAQPKSAPAGSTQTAEPTDDFYPGAESLMQAFVSAGGSCQGYKPSTISSTSWATAGTCEESKEFLTFVNDTQRDAFLALRKKLYGDQKEALVALRGSNWAVLAADAAVAQPRMGGEIEAYNRAGEQAVAAVLADRSEASAKRDAEGKPEPPADGGIYGSVAELRSAYLAAGGECPSFPQDNKVNRSAESGRCGDSRTLSTYLTSDDKTYVINNIKDFYEKTDSQGSGGSWLVGKNWILNVPDAKAMRWKLGGQLVSF